MKRKFFVTLSIIFMLLASFSVCAITPSAKATPTKAQKTVTSVNKRMVLESRFLNMLNHNFAYGEDIADVEGLVNASVIALLDMKDNGDERYIADSYVSDYILNMYGVECVDFSNINTEFPQKEGYVYILPRGYSLYEHTIDAVKLNEDGSYTVTTRVLIDSYDEVTEAYATTLFVKNDASQFGFNIISSEIYYNTSVI